MNELQVQENVQTIMNFASDIPVGYVKVQDILDMFGIKGSQSMVVNKWVERGWVPDINNIVAKCHNNGKRGKPKKDYYISPEAHARVLTHLRPAMKDMESLS